MTRAAAEHAMSVVAATGTAAVNIYAAIVKSVRHAITDVAYTSRQTYSSDSLNHYTFSPLE